VLGDDLRQTQLLRESQRLLAQVDQTLDQPVVQSNLVAVLVPHRLRKLCQLGLPQVGVDCEHDVLVGVPDVAVVGQLLVHEAEVLLQRFVDPVDAMLLVVVAEIHVRI